MSDVDRTSIHEAMEQQTISIARAGIVTTLSAQCTVIAAANPISGSYDRTVSLAENVHLTRPILSRFDLIHIITDEPSPESDYNLGKFVTASHRQSHPEVTRASRSHLLNTDSFSHENEEQIHEEGTSARNSEAVHAREDSDPSSSLPLYLSLFKKYIQYARSHCMPKILQVDPGRLPNLFAELRQVTPVTVRELESIIRLAEAHARIRLREFVQEEDFSEAIALFLRCYLKRHRLGEQRQLKAKFRKYLAIDDKRWIPLIETRLEEIIHTELALNKTDSEGQVRIAFETISGIVDKDGIPYTTLHKILSTQNLLGGKVRFEGDVLIFK
uniref:MCM C-terminal AAA(+) ATPase domain-containing protein n=1 Tax=Paramoeba aestuarina TaxID=180227 RepID=A0A7S4KED0_9EUKA